ncbi:MAG TPA: AbrB/MazE/SpoVT family DNA-binding domain-containing protein [Thermoanaerobaculia bacterium]|jgi:AbrB family looped-hinge helix DNA binding protein|nr:AbrB/MazE/SpoVT family DNA-binding domain-containing protein [Thermoanaerobaculia bacterium]
MDVPATVSSKGQVTLPKSVRDALGLKAGDRVLFRVHRGRAVLAKVESFLDLAGSVSVPPDRRGASWPAIKARAWQKRSPSRK